MDKSLSSLHQLSTYFYHQLSTCLNTQINQLKLIKNEQQFKQPDKVELQRKNTVFKSTRKGRYG